ncbi:MAG: hypothetical protein WA741_13025, partial [Candidatus Sulfotelmatobacter sp.]
QSDCTFPNEEEIIGSAERHKNSAMEGIVQAGILNCVGILNWLTVESLPAYDFTPVVRLSGFF